MKNLFLIFSYALMLSCKSVADKNQIVPKSSNGTKNIICTNDYDSLLIKYANEFIPKTVDLNSSLSSDLKSFLLSVDTTCLRKQKEYKYFISIVLGKLALQHLKCCHQFYDLYQMKEGAATIIINEFNKLAGYETERHEMLNSGLIMDYLKSDSVLSKNPNVVKLVSAVELESKKQLNNGI